MRTNRTRRLILRTPAPRIQIRRRPHPHPHLEPTLPLLHRPTPPLRITNHTRHRPGIRQMLPRLESLPRCRTPQR
jgi:hypothetical protein